MEWIANRFDPETHLAFASCGEGGLTVVKEDAPDKFSFVENVKTEPGARTMELDHKTDHETHRNLPPPETPNFKWGRRRCS
jgi:hypothetical protein